MVSFHARPPPFRRFAMRALVLTLVLVAGCAHVHPQWPDEGVKVDVGATEVTIQRRIIPARHARVIRAVEAHQAAFRARWGTVPPHELGVVDPEVRCGLLLEKDYWGCTIGKEVVVVSGGGPAGAAQGTPSESLPSYYHELYHLLVPEDLTHSDRHWDEVNARGVAVWQGLR